MLIKMKLFYLKYFFFLSSHLRETMNCKRRRYFSIMKITVCHKNYTSKKNLNIFLTLIHAVYFKRRDFVYIIISSWVALLLVFVLLFSMDMNHDGPKKKKFSQIGCMCSVRMEYSFINCLLVSSFILGSVDCDLFSGGRQPLKK